MKRTIDHDKFMRARLADAEFAAGYLRAALEDGARGVLLLALRRVAEARGGMTKLARQTGLTREALYRTLSTDGNPRLSSLQAILAATGLQLTIAPVATRRGRQKATKTTLTKINRSSKRRKLTNEAERPAATTV
jgi:probable addiction module antidote protein